MAAELIREDVIEGSGRMAVSGSGWTDVRAFRVRSDAVEPYRRKYDAIYCAGVPRRGQRHPIAPGATVQNVDAVAVDGSNKIYQVIVNYGGDAEGDSVAGVEGSGIKTLDVQTQTVSVSSLFDINGDRVVAEYFGPSRLVAVYNSESFVSPGIGSIAAPQTRFVEAPSSRLFRHGEAEYEITFQKISITTEEALPAFGFMRSLGRLPAMNSAPWSGEASKTWLLYGVDSSSNDSGGHDWRWTIGFNDETWQYKVSVEGYGGNFPDDLEVGNGIEFYDVYPSIDFSIFGWSIPR